MFQRKHSTSLPPNPEIQNQLRSQAYEYKKPKPMQNVKKITITHGQ